MIDTSALVNLHYYPRDLKMFAPIWMTLESMVKNGDLIAPLEVYEEIKSKEDEILEWCNKNKDMFIDIDDIQTNNLKKVEVKYDKEVWRKNISKVGGWADPWLIALCLSRPDLTDKNMSYPIIITDENNQGKNKISTIANMFGIKCINIIEFFRDKIDNNP
ncbi:MAG: DUF4411 family protein [Thermoplasmata archaeon]